MSRQIQNGSGNDRVKNFQVKLTHSEQHLSVSPGSLRSGSVLVDPQKARRLVLDLHARRETNAIVAPVVENTGTVSQPELANVDTIAGPDVQARAQRHRESSLVCIGTSEVVVAEVGLVTATPTTRAHKVLPGKSCAS